MKKRPVVFIVCPLTPRSTTENHAVEYLNYVRVAARAGAILLCNGFSVYCPANDFPYWLVTDNPPTAEDIYESDLNIIAKVDAVWAMGRFTQSENCMRELNYAEELGIPVFFTFIDLMEWKEKTWSTK